MSNQTKMSDLGQHVPGSPINQNLIGFGGKDTHYKNDAQRIYDYFYNNTDTRLGAFLHTGVLEKSICRYVDDFISDGRAQVVHLGRSPQSGIKNVQFISCNPALFNKQVIKPRDLFDDYGTD